MFLMLVEVLFFVKSLLSFSGKMRESNFGSTEFFNDNLFELFFTILELTYIY